MMNPENNTSAGLFAAAENIFRRDLTARDISLSGQK